MYPGLHVLLAAASLDMKWYLSDVPSSYLTFDFYKKIAT